MCCHGEIFLVKPIEDMGHMPGTHYPVELGALPDMESYIKSVGGNRQDWDS